MAYTPTNWKDRDVENPRTYTARQNEDGSITFFDAPGTINEAGTPVNAVNMNKIEEQLYKNDLERKITNCITEIPQDIKLELNNGTLTLKAGSKVYDGNGLLHTLTADSGANISYGAVPFLFFYERQRNTLLNFQPSRCGSGDTLPADGNTIFMFYLTTDKKVYRWINNSWSAAAGYSLPICIGTGDGSKISSIDQVFNGFGYIGSTVFALPGVKDLIPNGRNADGSLKNIEFTLSKVSITDAFNSKYLLGDNIVSPAYFTNYAEQEEQPAFTNGNWYQPSTNIMYAIRNSVATPAGLAYVLDVIVSDGVTTGLTPKLPFRAVDYNDFNAVINDLTKHVEVTSLPSTLEEDTFYYIPEA